MYGYGRKCGECLGLQFDHSYDSYSENYWCDKIHEWKHVNQPACDYFSSRSYLTSISTEILGMKRDNKYVRAIRKELDNLGEDPIAKKYDKQGYKSAIDVLISYNPKVIASNIFNTIVKPTMGLIEQHQEKEAMKFYITAVNIFVEESEKLENQRQNILAGRKRCELTAEEEFMYKNPYVKKIR